jgi:hypothetical protein
VLAGSQFSRDVLGKLEAMGCDPRQILAEIAMNPNEESGLRRLAAADLMRYCWPQLRAVEHSGANGGPIQVQAVDPFEAISSELARLNARTPTNGHAAEVVEPAT